jgi:hypothetical protein
MLISESCQRSDLSWKWSFWVVSAVRYPRHDAARGGHRVLRVDEGAVEPSRAGVPSLLAPGWHLGVPGSTWAPPLRRGLLR